MASTIENVESNPLKMEINKYFNNNDNSDDDDDTFGWWKRNEKVGKQTNKKIK